MPSVIFKKYKGGSYIIRWPPHKGDPPDGKHVVAVLRFYHWKGQRCPKWFQELKPDGYYIYWHPHKNEKPRTWSKEAKARVRKQRLERRLNKYALFKDVLYDEEIERDPEYFNAETQERNA